MLGTVFRYVIKLLKSHDKPGKLPVVNPKVEARSRMANWVRNRQVPGLAITLRINGVVVFEEGYGYANLERMQPVFPATTRFRAASVSKPIAATALLKMVAQGLINLDAPFHSYVPYFPKKPFAFTIRQLASHTAGIRSYRGKEYALNQPMGIKESLAIFQDDPLLFEPGTGYHYNSYDWVLVSLAMQEAAGTPFAEYVSREVLQPLGMAHTLPEVPGMQQPDLASFYSPAGDGFRKAIPVNNAYKLAGGGYLTTTADIARLGQAYLNGVVGDPKLVSQFLNTQYVAGVPTYYGLGWEVSRDQFGRPFFGHTGNSIGAYSKFRVYPESAMVVAVLANCTSPGIEAELEEVLGLFREG